MIIKIMKAAGNSFPGVKYNDTKIEQGNGQLMTMKNFPAGVNESSSKEKVKDYLKSVSQNRRVTKPQFHAVISTKFREHSAKELTRIAEEVMKEMGYEEQPYIVVAHSDTENNHVHIVSTRIDKNTGKKIDDSYERLKAQRSIEIAMKKIYGVNNDENIEKLMNYNFRNSNQLELLLERNGYKSILQDNSKSIDIFKNGALVQNIQSDEIKFSTDESFARKKQLKAILSKYKDLYSSKVFRIEDNRKAESLISDKKDISSTKGSIEFESELQEFLRNKFGIDIVFHNKDGKNPFGYSLIDHKSKTVFKGSEVLPMSKLFEITSEKIDKRLFEKLKNYNVDSKTKSVLATYLKNQKVDVKDFMLFDNKLRKDKETYKSIQDDVKDYLQTQKNDNVTVFKGADERWYAIHSKHHFVSDLEKLVGTKSFENFINPEMSSSQQSGENVLMNKDNASIEKILNDLEFDLTRTTGGGTDPAEQELKKRKRKRR